jgi:NhaP-type Na+/H+ and K+/H+ antiporter
MILVAGALLATALGASLLAGRLRVPGLVAFLGIGMAVGSDGFGWIDFSDYQLERNIGIVALGLILFEGGLATSIEGLMLSLQFIIVGICFILPWALVLYALWRFMKRRRRIEPTSTPAPA